ncbi:MAG: hypothetical protein K0S93_578 [Nitrososphaeraceae archaeon]|jgi:hypothetical protein|nr:hypothetical protein [Nitrososphaeraceae archaeon]
MVFLKNDDHDIIFIVNLLQDFPRLGPNALTIWHYHGALSIVMFGQLLPLPPEFLLACDKMM